MKGDFLRMNIDWIELKEQSKKHVAYNVAVILCAVLALVFLVMAIVAVFSLQSNEGIAVKEAFDVFSSPLDAENQNFVSQLSGYLINYEDHKTQIEKIIIVVGNGRERAEVELEGLMLYPRLSEEIRYEWKTSFDFDRIHSLTVIVDGERQLLANNTIEWEFNPDIIFYVLLCAVCCFGTVFAAKKRYYRYQEDQMEARSTEEQS